MGRIVSANLKARARETITSPGYLVRWNMAPAMLWSNIGARVFGGETFGEFDFTLSGLTFDSDTPQAATLKGQNLDSTLAAIILNASMSDVTVDVWAFDRGALGYLDRVKFYQLNVDDCEVELPDVTVQLREPIHFSPRRRIAPAYGFNYAMPRGSLIPWESEIFETEAADRG